ncbi:hypothetical protein [Klebsiella aerogenes]|uniref:hypothetical protein n=1 Tax=Klebsiella aerogenes TaxID=548 RepID=UPI001CD9C90D|nr:hypothetical protein [Klebsiella aerogenes]
MKITTMAALSAMLLLAACASSKTEKEKKIDMTILSEGYRFQGKRFYTGKIKVLIFTVINIWSISRQTIIRG